MKELSLTAPKIENPNKCESDSADDDNVCTDKVKKVKSNIEVNKSKVKANTTQRKCPLKANNISMKPTNSGNRSSKE